MNHGMAAVLYKLSFNYTDYYNLDLDLEELGDELEDALGEDGFYDYSWNNTALKEHWTDIGATFIDVGLSNQKAPDITTWNGANLVLSEKAYIKIKSALEALGEFLPLTINKSKYYVFNCLNVVEADKTQSEADIVNNLWMGVKSIGFDDITVNNNLLFKTRFDRCSAIYCGDKFKNIIEDAGLEGLNFNKDLLTSF